jgi:anti-sigma factor RsiW
VNCQEFVELVTAYLEDQLPGDDRAAFEEHLRLCPGCDRYLEQFRTTIALLGQLPEESISAPARDRLLDAFADWRARGGPGVGNS